MQQSVNTLINRQNGDLAIKVLPFQDSSYFSTMQRHNYYSMILTLTGSAHLDVDLEQYDVPPNSMICLSPFQPYRISSEENFTGIILNFHPDFFCTYRYQNEVETEGTLFHNIYEPPFFYVSDTPKLLELLAQMETEINKSDIALHEVLVAYIKIFLIQVLRMKQADTKIEIQRSDAKEPQIIQQLVDTIEREFKRLHSPAEYAEVLNISPNALAKIVKKYYNKTLTEIIAQRIMIEAKRELYLTGKTVKEIAYILGYEDEFYFSRFFKKHAQISPQLYRETVGFDKLRVLGLI